MYWPLQRSPGANLCIAHRFVAAVIIHRHNSPLSGHIPAGLAGEFPSLTAIRHANNPHDMGENRMISAPLRIWWHELNT